MGVVLHSTRLDPPQKGSEMMLALDVWKWEPWSLLSRTSEVVLTKNANGQQGNTHWPSSIFARIPFAERYRPAEPNNAYGVGITALVWLE